MKSEKIAKTGAVRLVLHAQLLDGRTKFPRGAEGAARVIEHLGYVQIDTIQAVKRAHHHVLQTRLPRYRNTHIYDLLAKKRRVFEYWTHALSYVPMTDYKYFQASMKRSMDPIGKWEKQRMEKYGHLMKPVLERIRKEGPLESADFEQSTRPREGWDPKPARAALSLLFLSGRIMVTERRKFRRIFDLTERVLPDDVDLTEPDKDERGRYHVRRALTGLGLATLPEIQYCLGIAGKETVAQAVSDMTDAGEIVPVRIEGIGNGANSAAGVHYALPGLLDAISGFRKKKPLVRILSPFDNLIIQRNRTRKLFGFDYCLECYLPAAKRKYGYFVLPILFGEAFAGRMDAKADRKNRVMIVNNLWLEPGIDPTGPFLNAFASSLRDFAAFNECDNIKIEDTTPRGLKTKLKKH